MLGKKGDGKCPSSMLSNSRIGKIVVAHRVMLTKNHTELLNLHLELISLLESEGLFLTELGYRYRCVARYYIDKGEKQKAVRYAISGLENDLNCFGADSPLVEDAADFLKLIQGQRQQYQFGGSDGYFKYS